MKYNKKTLWDFINNESFPQNITDHNFYIDAINITNNKDLYYRCPKEIQNNYIFVQYIIDKFKEDTCFINEIAQNYLAYTPEYDYTHQELIFIMSNLIHDFRDDYYFLYQIKKDMIYTSKRALIEEFLEEHDIEGLGLGFLLVLENEKSKIIADYFATVFIEEIFYDRVNFNLEEIIHITYKERFDFVTYGIDNFIVEFIASFDGYLAHYIKNNMFLTNDIRKYIKNIAKRWKKYEKENYENKKIELKKQIQTIISKYNSSLTIREIYKYIDKKSSLLPLRLSEDTEDNSNILDDKKIKIKDYKCLKEALNKAEDIFDCGEIKKEENKKHKGKILEFKPNNKEK